MWFGRRSNMSRSARLVAGGRDGLCDSRLPLRAVEKYCLRAGLPIPTSPAVRPDDSRHRFGGGARPYVSRRISGTVARDAPAAFFGSVSHGAQGRPDSPRPTRPPGWKTRRPPDDRCSPTVNRRAAAARRILPTLSDAFQDAAKRPVAVPAAAAQLSPPPVESSRGPTDAGCRADHPSRRRRRQHRPRRDVLPRREGGPHRATLARWGEKREAGADEPWRPCAPLVTLEAATCRQGGLRHRGCVP
jgi:hypothetical protein